jgi:hypothetical protein
MLRTWLFLLWDVDNDLIRMRINAIHLKSQSLY